MGSSLRFAFVRRGAAAPLALAAAVLCGASPAALAVPLELVYSGTLSTQEALNLRTASTPTFFTASTPFTIRAFFDDSSPNLLPTTAFPFGGFRAYNPSSATITIGAQTFSIETQGVNATAGVAVAIFDRSQIFNPGRYGVGLIADVARDGAGIVGDFSTASPNYTAGALPSAPIVFLDYYGVGHGSGVCLSGSPPACPHAVTPWVLRDSANVAWNLTLGNYEEDYPVAHTAGAPLGTLNSAAIIAVPEPATVGLMAGGLLALAGAARRRR